MFASKLQRSETPNDQAQISNYDLVQKGYGDLRSFYVILVLRVIHVIKKKYAYLNLIV